MLLTVIYKDMQPTINGVVHLNEHVAPTVRRITVELSSEQKFLLKKGETEDYHLVFFEETEQESKS